MKRILKNNIATPSYIQLRNILHKNAVRMSPGAQMPSVREMIKCYKVSQNTVEKALFELEKDKLIEKIPGRGIFVRDRGADNLKHLIAAMVGDASDKFTSLMIKGIEDEAAKHGFSLMIIGRDGKEKSKLADGIGKQNPDGIIIYNNFEDLNSPSYISELRELLKLNPRCVFTELPVPGVPVPAVCSDNYKAGYEAASELLGKKLNGILFCWQPFALVQFERLCGFRRCLKDNNLDFDEKKIMLVNLPDKEKSFDKILADSCLENPVGIFNAMPSKSTDFLLDMQQSSLEIGKDIVFSGIFEQDFRENTREKVTAFVKPSYKIGLEAARLLIDRIFSDNKKSDTSCIRIPFEKTEML